MTTGIAFVLVVISLIATLVFINTDTLDKLQCSIENQRETCAICGLITGVLLYELALKILGQ